MQTTEILPDDPDQALNVKLRRLRGLVDRARSDPRLRRLAEQIVSGVRERDAAGERRAVSAFVRRTRYTRDPVGVEYFQDPRLLAGRIVSGTVAAADCDDTSALGAALLESIGHPTRFVTGGSRQGWSHIWLEALDQATGRWHAIDDTRRDRPTGWNPAPLFERTMKHDGHYRNPCYGGAAALQGMASLDGFSLKRIAKKVAKVVTTPTKVVAKAVGKATKAVASVAAPIVGTIVAGPVGAAAGGLISRSIVGGGAAAPTAPPLVVAADHPAFPGAFPIRQPIIPGAPGGRMPAPSAVYTSRGGRTPRAHTVADDGGVVFDPVPAIVGWMPWIVGGGVVLAVLLATGRKRR